MPGLVCVCVWNQMVGCDAHALPRWTLGIRMNRHGEHFTHRAIERREKRITHDLKWHFVTQTARVHTLLCSMFTPFTCIHRFPMRKATRIVVKRFVVFHSGRFSHARIRTVRQEVQNPFSLEFARQCEAKRSEICT